MKVGLKTKASIYSMVSSIMNFGAITIFNLVYYNYLIQIYGSEVNGLISTLTQFVSLFAIIEGGFTTASVVATYKPIIDKDYKKLNDILYTTKRTYYRLGILITGAVLICGSIYIRFIDSPFSYAQTYALLIISVLTTAFSLCFLSKYSVLLQGDNKEYIFTGLSLVSRTVTWMLSMFLIVKGVNIVLVFAINTLNILVNTSFIRCYERKNYNYVTYKGNYDKSLISGTEDVLFQKIANTVFTSTDLVIISVFINLASASVYNLYYQIFRAMYNLLGSVAQAPFNSFGQLANDKESRNHLKDYFNIYQHTMLIAASVLLGTTGSLVIPFVKVYTANIRDIDYIYPTLAVLFFLQTFTQIINRPYGTILNATGNFRMQNIQCFLAAVLNIIVSVAFIKQWGICSIVFGSFVATFVILAMNIYQAYRNVLHSSMEKTIRNIIMNYGICVLFIVIMLKVNIVPESYLIWVACAVPVFLANLAIVLILNFLMDKKSTISVIKYIWFSVLKKM